MLFETDFAIRHPNTYARETTWDLYVIFTYEKKVCFQCALVTSNCMCVFTNFESCRRGHFEWASFRRAVLSVRIRFDLKTSSIFLWHFFKFYLPLFSFFKWVCCISGPNKNPYSEYGNSAFKYLPSSDLLIGKLSNWG